MSFDISINSLYICVKDMERGIHFYERFLEMPVSVKWGDNCLPSFEVSDLDRLLEKLKNLGAEIVFPLTKINDNWVLEFIDSEGNDIEVYCKILKQES